MPQTRPATAHPSKAALAGGIHITTLLVPILFAVAGAAVTARRLDPRSVYSGRVHTGRKAAEAEPLAIDLPYRRLMTLEVKTISIAANYTEVLERFVAEAGHSKPLYVIDEKARLSGRIEACSAACPPALTRILSAAAAGDLMDQVKPLSSALTQSEAIARLKDEPSGELPVIDANSGRLLGVAIRP
jgi:CBS-domain-containing membrane protein